MDRRFHTFPSFIFSLFLYIAFVFAIFFRVSQSEVVKYTTSPEDFIDVFIDINPDESSKNSAKFDEIEAEKTTNKKTSSSSKPSANKGDIQDLFNTINSEDLNKAIQSRKKSAKETTTNKSARDLVDSLQIEKPKNNKAKQNSGIYDEYKGKITEILQNYWRYYKATTDNNATAQITIDKNGKFSFKIVELSQDFDFNKKVRRFLNDMTNITFPISPEGVSVINVILQDRIQMERK